MAKTTRTAPAEQQEIAPAALMAALRERGAEAFDPVRFRFIEALARRSQAYRGEARRLLDQKLAQALTAYSARFEQARDELDSLLPGWISRFPDAADELRRLYALGDVKAVRRLVAERAEPGASQALADLVAQVAPRPAGPDLPALPQQAASPAAHGELKALSYFRDTWSKLSVEQQLTEALAQAPENAGPLNAHLLVLESLKRMRDISPAYLNRFISYVDALLWLDQANGFGMPAAKNAARAEKGKKKKSPTAT